MAALPEAGSPAQDTSEMGQNACARLPPETLQGPEVRKPGWETVPAVVR